VDSDASIESSSRHRTTSRPSIRPGRRTATGSRSSASSTARVALLDRARRSNELQLTFDEDSHDREPSFSPSGNKIVYGGQNDDGESGLFVIPALGGPRERLTNPRPSGVDANPYWASTP
jgi:Tol biopolymer transport system component